MPFGVSFQHVTLHAFQHDNVCMYMIHVVLHALTILPQTIYCVGLMATVKFNPESGIEMEDLPDDAHAHRGHSV